MALEIYPSWNFRDQRDLYSATTDMDLCWESNWSDCTLNAQPLIPHYLPNSSSSYYEFPNQSIECLSSVGLDLLTCSSDLISKPEAIMTQFNDTYLPDVGLDLLVYPGASESDIGSCITEPIYQDDQRLMSPESSNFMDFDLDFTEVELAALQYESAVVPLASPGPQIILPCHVEGEAKRDRLILENLLKALAEATEREAWDLLKVIVNRLQRMVSPIGTHLERVGYHLLESFRPQDAARLKFMKSMKEVCMQSSLRAFQALYELYPYARIAHFTANQSIVEYVNRSHKNSLHIVDFDVMEGLQWPPLMEALADNCLERLRITAIKWDDEEAAGQDGIAVSVGKTGCRLADCAVSLRIPFVYEEVRLQDLKQHLLFATAEAQEDETLLFNMMVQLPHMTSQKSKLQIVDFLSVSRDLPCAMLTLACAGMESESELKGFGGHVNERVEYFTALLESVEAGLPNDGLARSVLEHIFVAPKIQKSVSTSLRNEKEIICGKLSQLPGKCGFGRAGVEISEENMAQAREVLAFSRGSSFYTVERSETATNELTLKWRGTPLVSVSAWR